MDINNLQGCFEQKMHEHLGEHYSVLIKNSTLEIRAYAPSAARPFEVLTTFGLSSSPCSVPESWQNEHEAFGDVDWNELMIALDADISEENRLWAAQLLISVSECARREGRYLASGQFFELIHTPLQPWRAAVITAPQRQEFAPLVSFRGPYSQRCFMLAVIPVLKEEISVLKNQGFSAFDKQLAMNHVSEIFCPERLSFTIPQNASLLYA